MNRLTTPPEDYVSGSSAASLELPIDIKMRRDDRVPAELRSIVQVKEGPEDVWKEVTTVTTISKNGAGFSLPRPCAVGRLVTLVLPMPEDLRVYDQKEPLYPVLGLVQYCNEGLADGNKCYHVGVAFIGKQLPPSFKADPLQSYRITGMSREGLWTITETDCEFKTRRHPRYWVAIDAAITVLHVDRKVSCKGQGVTQNIGANGASVRTTLSANVGDKVKLACKDFDFYSIGIVRDRQEVDEQTPTLHIEFVDSSFPIEKLLAALNEDANAESARGLMGQTDALPWNKIDTAVFEYDRH